MRPPPQLSTGPQTICDSYGSRRSLPCSAGDGSCPRRVPDPSHGENGNDKPVQRCALCGVLSPSERLSSKPMWMATVIPSHHVGTPCVANANPAIGNRKGSPSPDLEGKICICCRTPYAIYGRAALERTRPALTHVVTLALPDTASYEASQGNEGSMKTMTNCLLLLKPPHYSWRNVCVPPFTARK